MAFPRALLRPEPGQVLGLRRSFSPSSVHPAIPAAAAFIVGIAMTAGFIWLDWLPSAYRSGQFAVALNTVDGCVAVLVAYLVHGRYLREGRMRDRLVGHGLALLGVAALLVPVTSDALGLRALHSADLWAAATVRLAAAVLIAGGALLGERKREVRAPRLVSSVGPLVFVALVLVLARALGPQLPVPVLGIALSPTTTTPQPAFAALQVLAAVGFLIAALAFSRRTTVADDLVAAMAPAFAFGTVALLNYALFPTAYTGWLYSGDVFRTICYLLLLAGAAIEIRRYWTDRTRLAVLQDRRRLAREIHDGVVQEIVYIRLEGQALRQGDATAARIVEACDRALDEARDAVHALAAPRDEPLEHQLQRAAHDLSRRFDISVRFTMHAPVDVTAPQQHALVRIAREAISNAARHGRARQVDVRLAADGTARTLEVVDDGRGFDLVATTGSAGGYGLTSMRERAESMPGSLSVESAPGAGTTVKVTW
jgi:signal transduction histidine kinase